MKVITIKDGVVTPKEAAQFVRTIQGISYFLCLACDAIIDAPKYGEATHACDGKPK